MFLNILSYELKGIGISSFITIWSNIRSSYVSTVQSTDNINNLKSSWWLSMPCLINFSALKKILSLHISSSEALLCNIINLFFSSLFNFSCSYINFFMFLLITKELQSKRQSSSMNSFLYISINLSK